MTQPSISIQTIETRETNPFDPSFHELANFLPEAMIILDKTMLVVYLNSAAENLFGYSTSEAVGQNLDIFLHETSIGPYHIHKSHLLKKDENAARRMGENRLIFGKHRDGHIIPLDMSLTRRIWHDQAFVVCIPRDISNQIAYQQALKENELQFRSIFMEHSAVMLLVEPKSGRILEANTAAIQFYGFSRQQLRSMLIDQINIMDSDQVAAERALAMTRKNNYFNFRHKLASGEIRDVEVYSTPIVSGGETILFSIIHDNTDRKRMQQALLQTSARLSLATQAGGIGIWDWDVVNNNLVWDDTMFRLYGITPDQFTGAYEAWQAGLHPEDRQQGDLEIQLALQGQKEFNIEFRVIWPDGSLRFIRGMARVQRDATGRPLRMIGTNWDVTAQKQAEKELSNQIALLSGLLDSIPDIVFFKDAQGVYLGCNPEFARFVGRPAADILHKTDYDLFDRETADFFHQNDLAMMLAGDERHNEEWITYPGGKRVLIDTLKAPLRDGQGEVIGLLGVSRDITQRKLAEELVLIERNAAILLAQKSTLAEALPLCLDLALQVSGMDCGGIYTLDRLTSDLLLTTHKGLSEPFITQVGGFKPGSDRYQLVMGGAPIYQPYLTIPLSQNQIDEDEILHMLAVVPVAFEGSVIACVNVASHSLDDMPDSCRIALENLALNFGQVIARFQVQDELAQSRNQLESMFNSLQDFVFVLDQQGSIIQVNQKVMDGLGYSYEELLGKSVLEMHPPEQRPGAWQMFQDVLAGFEQTWSLDLLKKDASRLPVEMKIVQGHWGNQAVLIGVSRDITERKAAEEERFHQATLLEYRNCFEELLTSISTRFINLSLTEINPEINRVLKQVGEFEGVDRSYVFLLNHDADRIHNTHEWCAPGIEPQIAMLQDIPLHLFPWWQGKLQKLEEIYIPLVSALPPGAQSERIFLEVLSIKSALLIPLVANGTPVGILGFDSISGSREWSPESILLTKMVGDILSNALMRKQMETELRQSEERNRALLSAVPDQIYRIRRDGVFLDFKASSSELLLAPPDQIIGAPLKNILSGPLAEKAMLHLELALQSKKIQTLEFIFKTGDSSHVFEARFKDSGPEEVTAIVREISDRARLEQMKSDFINRATHELRTPIATILLMVNLIEGGTTPQEYHEYWDVLKSELNRERILIEDLLSAGRLESNQLDLHVSSFNLAEFISQITRQIEPPAREKRISLSLQTLLNPQASSPLIQADEKALTQVLVNLLGNAIKFTPSGGNVNVLLQKKDSGFEISIIDTGMGIPSEDLPLLFTRFFRGTNAIENEIPGTGIGLFIVQSILEKHGGSINVHSELGKGSRFIIWLPSKAACLN